MPPRKGCGSFGAMAPPESTSPDRDAGTGSVDDAGPPSDPFSPSYVEEAAAVLSLLSHPTRLHLVLLIAVTGGARVGSLAEALDLAPSNVSHHLRLLRDAGLVGDERDGQYVVYRLEVGRWRSVADGFFDSLLGGSDSVTLQNVRIERLPDT